MNPLCAVIFLLRRWCFCLFALLLVWAPLPAWTQVVAGEQGWSPATSEPAPQTQLFYLVYEGAGQPYQGMSLQPESDGVISDIVFKVFESSPFQLTFRVLPVRRIKRDMYSGQLQSWIAYGFRLWADDPVWGGQYLSRVNLFDYRYGLMTFRKDGNLPPNLDVYGDSAALMKLVDGARVVVISGFQYGGLDRLLLVAGAKLIPVSDQHQALSVLARGRADFYLGNPQRNVYLLEHDEHYQQFPPLRVIDLGVSTPVTLLLSEHSSPALRDWVDNRLEDLVANGFVAEVLARYGIRTQLDLPVTGEP